MGKFFPSTSIIFKYFDRRPYVSYQNEEIKIPINEDLKGLDVITLSGNKDFMIQVSTDETQLILTNEPKGKTQLASDNSTKLATTEYVKLQGYLTSADISSLSIDGGTF